MTIDSKNRHVLRQIDHHMADFEHMEMFWGEIHTVYLSEWNATG